MTGDTLGNFLRSMLGPPDPHPGPPYTHTLAMPETEEEITAQPYLPTMTVDRRESCRVYWGSHGCEHPRGHPLLVPHDCGCCECGEHHPYPDWPDENVLCVAKPPYYGPETRFYGEDAEALGLPLVSAPN